jgi:hypothetical protein
MRPLARIGRDWGSPITYRLRLLRLMYSVPSYRPPVTSNTFGSASLAPLRSLRCMSSHVICEDSMPIPGNRADAPTPQAIVGCSTRMRNRADERCATARQLHDRGLRPLPEPS